MSQTPAEIALEDVEKLAAQTISDFILAQGIQGTPKVAYLSDPNSTKKNKEDVLFAELLNVQGLTVTKKTDLSDVSTYTNDVLVTDKGEDYLESQGALDLLKTAADVLFFATHGTGLPELEDFDLVQTTPLIAGTGIDAASETVQIYKRIKVYI